jgi:hypothetical protein
MLQVLSDIITAPLAAPAQSVFLQTRKHKECKELAENQSAIYVRRVCDFDGGVRDSECCTPIFLAVTRNEVLEVLSKNYHYKKIKE